MKTLSLEEAYQQATKGPFTCADPWCMVNPEDELIAYGEASSPMTFTLLAHAFNVLPGVNGALALAEEALERASAMLERCASADRDDYDKEAACEAERGFTRSALIVVREQLTKASTVEVPK